MMNNYLKTFFKRKTGAILKIAAFALFLFFNQLGRAATLSGTYTINSGAPATTTNFRDFNSAFIFMTSAGARPDAGPANVTPFGVSGPVTFDVAAGSGPYTEQLTMGAITGASATNRVTFNGNGNTIQFNTVTSGMHHVIRFATTSFVTINNLVIKTLGTNLGWGIHMYLGSNNNVINGCTIDLSSIIVNTTNSCGISMSATTTSAISAGVNAYFNTISNNLFIGASPDGIGGMWYAITNCQSSNLTVSANKIFRNTFRDFHGTGIYMLNTNGTLIQENRFHRPTRTTSTTTYAVFGTTGMQRDTVERNRVHDMFVAMPGNTSTAYFFYTSTVNVPVGGDVIFRNNALYNIHGNGLHSGFYFLTSSNIRVFHNTISFDNPISATTSTTYGIFSSGTLTGAGLDIKNNIISITKTGGGTRFGIYFATAGTLYACNRNNIFVSNPASSNWTGFYLANFATLANWQTANGNAYDQNSFAVDPFYENAANGLLDPSNAILDNKGTNVGVTNDLNGLTRSVTTPDLGATEFVVVAIDASPSLENNFTKCGNASQPVTVRVTNRGSSTISDIPVTVRVTGAVTTTLSGTLTGSLAPTASGLLSLTPLSTVNGGTFNLEIFTSLAGEQKFSNDTSRRTFITDVSPGAPAIANVSQCGTGPVTVKGNFAAGTQGVWFDSPTSLIPLAIDSQFTTPHMVPPSTVSYYVAAGGVSSPDNLGNGYRNWTWYSNFDAGTFFDLTGGTEASSYVVDSFSFVPVTTNITNISVYYRLGTVIGNQSNPAGWTLLGTVVNQSVTAGTLNTIRVGGLNIPAGQTYGIYLFFNNNGPWLANNVGGTSNGDLTISGTGYASWNGLFSANTAANLQYDGRVFYRRVCAGPRTQVDVTAKVAPFGASMIKGSPFQGTMTSGMQSDPDIVKGGDILTYELTPPTGYTNGDFGTSWTATATVKYASGANVNPALYTIGNPAAGNGFFQFRPTAALTDSLIHVTYRISDLGPSFCDSIVSKFIFVAPVARPNFTAPSVCKGAPMSFTNISQVSTGSMSYLWNFGDGNTSVNTSPVHVYANFGTYNVKLTATTNYGYAKDTTIVVTVNEVPNVAFDRNNKCEGDSVNLINTTTTSMGSPNYLWNFGDGNTSTSKSKNHLYATPGNYEVTLTANLNGCVGQLTKTVYQFPNPKANFTSNGNCNLANIRFTNSSTIASGTLGYFWSFPGGNTSTEINPVHVFANFGSQNVKLRAISEFGCKDSVTKAIVLNESPVANFSTTKACSIDPVQFANSSTSPGTAFYQWNFNDGNTSNAQNPTHVFANYGMKTVTLSVSSSNGCSNAITKQVDVKIQPVADFTTGTACQGSEVPFVNKSKTVAGTMTYLWRFGDNNTSTSQAPNHVYAANNNYDVTLITSVVGGCVDSVKKQVVVNKTPVCDFTIASNQTGDRKVNFIPAETGLNYEWTFGDGGNSTLQQPLYQYFFDGAFNVKLTATNSAGCSCSMTKTLNMQKTGINDINSLNAKVMIFPNPSKGAVTIRIESAQNNAKISIFNILGEKILDVDTANSNSGEFTADLGHVANGVYTVRIENGNEISTQKITINR